MLSLTFALLLIATIGYFTTTPWPTHPAIRGIFAVVFALLAICYLLIFLGIANPFTLR